MFGKHILSLLLLFGHDSETNCLDFAGDTESYNDSAEASSRVGNRLVIKKFNDYKLIRYIFD